MSTSAQDFQTIVNYFAKDYGASTYGVQTTFHPHQMMQNMRFSAVVHRDSVKLGEATGQSAEEATARAIVDAKQKIVAKIDADAARVTDELKRAAEFKAKLGG